MILKFIDGLSLRLNTGNWFRRGLAIFIACLTIRLTTWGMHFADLALEAKADLTGVAAVLAAVGALPVAFVTILANKYIESRNNDSGN